MGSDAAFAGDSIVAALAVASRVSSIELLLFASTFIILFGIGDLLIDTFWLANRKLWRDIPHVQVAKPISHRLAIFIPAWQGSEVIGRTLSHIERSWSGDDYRLYIGCYHNDEATLLRVAVFAALNPKIRIVVHNRPGPTTKADCLNSIWQGLLADEHREGGRYDAVILHDAEDFVDPAELSLFDEMLLDHAFVQLPVIPVSLSHSSWVAGHYCDEFAEAHQKDMPVRHALGVPIPAAGVGCAFRRDALERIGAQDGPFSSASLVEDYELGLSTGASGLSSIFVRRRNSDGSMIAVRSYFPVSLEWSVRQKARWVSGIALSGWDRLGWSHGLSAKALASNWMLWRDRRTLLAAIITLTAYLGAVLLLVSEVAGLAVQQAQSAIPPTLVWMFSASTFILIWRLIMRAVCTWRAYGFRQGLFAIPRAFVSNVIAVLASRRAVLRYARSLTGAQMVWDKTHHPAALNPFDHINADERARSGS